MAQSTYTIRLFVYGTLKRGFANHARYCEGIDDVAPARVRGRLYDLPAGYPMLVVPPGDVIARGTTHPEADARTLAEWETRWKAPRTPRCEDAQDWGPVTGEVLTISDPAIRLPGIEALEQFEPGGTGMYDRVLVPVLEGAFRLAWTYVAPEGRLPAGATRRAGTWP